MPHRNHRRAWPRYVESVVLAAAVSCSQAPEPAANSAVSAPAPGNRPRQVTVPGPNHLINVFADEVFYRERSEPESEYIGVLRQTPVRTGPNTRDMPLRLEIARESLSLYVTDRLAARLQAFVGRRVRVTGKRVDLRPEGHGFELWAATVALDEP